jgi:topoisomerase-4 subunit B
VIDNAADEALAGYGKKIKFTMHADGSYSVEDDGRGIPFGLHPEEKAPVVELVFTRLHAGGKFDKGNGGAYSFSGGLHGVGVSVTNALATRLEVQVHRDGQVATLVFSGGDVIEPLKVRPLQAGERKQGTTVRAWPDAKYFESSALPMGELVHLLRSKAVLMPGVAVSLINENRVTPRAGSSRAACATIWRRACMASPSSPCSKARALPTRTTTALPKARARPGAWPSPKTARRCARAMST